MKVSYTFTSVINWVVLFDEAAGDSALAEFPPQFSQVLQRDPKFRGAAEFRQIRDNAFASFPLEFVKSGYASRAAALQSVSDMRALSRVKLHLKIEQDATVTYYPNATANNYSGRLQGQACTHRFDFISDDVTNTAPT
jgi:hypothetical protein